jgi:flagellar protein FliL
MEERSIMAPETQKKQKSDAKPKVESKPIVENKTDAEPAKKSGKRWILMGIAALVLIAGGAAFWAIPHFKATGKASADAKAERTEKSPVELVKATLALEPFLVNLADTDESRFVKGSFQLGLAEELGEKEKDPVAIAAMRDSIITLLSSKTADQILTPQGKDKLRDEIRTRINSVSPQIKVLEVFIVDFVVQL